MIELVGPFSEAHKVTLNGFRVPYLTAYSQNPQKTEWTIVLDERMGIDLTEDRLDQIVNFIADALAVGAGYKSFADACNHQGERHNPFGSRMIRISRVEDEQEETS